MTQTVASVDVEPVDRLAEKVKSLIAVLERTRHELSQTRADNERLRQEVTQLTDRVAEAGATRDDVTRLLSERAQIQSRVGELLAELDAINI